MSRLGVQKIDFSRPSADLFRARANSMLGQRGEAARRRVSNLDEIAGAKQPRAMMTYELRF
jgi:hypothetical protein